LESCLFFLTGHMAVLW